MTDPALSQSVKFARENQRIEADNKTLFGFWVYLMTDCILFASLFATFIVLRNNTFGGPGGQQLFNLNFVLSETLILLTSSYTCGLSMLAAHQRSRHSSVNWLLVTMVLGLTFLGLELSEFHHLAQEGDSWRRSGFLSSYFTLVGTHGLHITVGLIWMAITAYRASKQGLNRFTQRQLSLLSLFWHFLDIIWIFIFSIVYLAGKL